MRHLEHLVGNHRSDRPRGLFNDDLVQSARGGLWKNAVPSVNIARLDRLFVGEAATNATGNDFNATQGSIIPTDTQGGSYLIRDAQALSIARTGLIAISGISRSSDQNSVPNACIGVSGAIINNKSSANAWGLYSDLQHESGAGNSYGLEVAGKNKGSNQNPDPYGLASGVYGVWLAGGGDATYGGAPTNPSSAAIVVLSNAHTWNKGIVFENGALTGTFAEAILLPTSYQIVWYRVAGSVGASIRSDVHTVSSNVSLTFDDNFVGFFGTSGKAIFDAVHTASGVNNIRVTNAVTGSAPIVAARGDDTNVDLTLSGQGTGRLRLGTASMMAANAAVATVLGSVGPTGAATTVQEWLAVKNSAGTTRFIPCF